MPSIASEGIHVTAVTDFSILIPTLLIEVQTILTDFENSLRPPRVFLSGA
jgi:hypothetical protein